MLIVQMTNAKQSAYFIILFVLFAALVCDSQAESHAESTNDTMKPKRLEAKWSRLSADRPWQNSLGMKLVPVPNTKVLFCIWLTRVQDYEAYATASLGANVSWRRRAESYGLPINNGPDYPICYVSWEDAKGFCRWLSRREQELGLIAGDCSYRLPTDEEWSHAVGLVAEKGKTPGEKHKNAQRVFPWGSQWPPPTGAGNFADETLHASNSIYPRIVGYSDGFATTSPVGSFPPNKAGLFDMSGNLLEWCEDEYAPDGKMPTHLKATRPLRGGAWTSVYDVTLTSGHRHYENPKVRYDYYGFRIVLAKGERK